MGTDTAVTSPSVSVDGATSRSALPRMLRYFAGLSVGRAILWCYLIWYGVMASFHFDSSPRLWVTSLGISAVIGVGLLLSVARSGVSLWQDRWQVFRLFLMPFCVSSFSALVKDHGFILIFSPRWNETALALAGCGGFLAIVWVLHRYRGRGLVSGEPHR